MNSISKELADEILKWDSFELLQIIIIMGSLPQNREKIIRLETLFKIVSSLPEHEFKNNKFSKTSLQIILLKLSQVCSWEFVEDYQPISVLDYSPIWILGPVIGFF